MITVLVYLAALVDRHCRTVDQQELLEPCTPLDTLECNSMDPREGMVQHAVVLTYRYVDAGDGTGIPMRRSWRYNTSLYR